jgi:hypothetical protein
MSAPAVLPADTLLALLRPQRLTAVVDVGANPIDGDAPYKPMLSRRLCTVTGFEPQPDGLASLNARPDVPTMREHLPAPIVGKFNATLDDILRSPEAKESLAKLNVLQSAFWFSSFVFEGE